MVNIFCIGIVQNKKVHLPTNFHVNRGQNKGVRAVYKTHKICKINKKYSNFVFKWPLYENYEVLF